MPVTYNGIHHPVNQKVRLHPTKHKNNNSDATMFRQGMKNEYAEHVAKKTFKYMYKLYQSKNNCDLVLKLEENKKIFAHACVVLARIPTLSKKLLEVEHIREITLRGVHDRELELVMQYCYLETCEVDEISSDVLKLFTAALHLRMEDLCNFCLDKLKETMDASTAVKLLNDLDSGPGDTRPHKIAEKYILRHLTTYLPEYRDNQDSWQFRHISSKRMLLLILDPALHAPYEEMAWITIMLWIKYAPDVRRSVLPQLIRVLRLGMIHSEFLEQIDSELLSNENAEAAEVFHEIIRQLNQVMLHGPETPLPLALQPRLPHATIISVGGIIETNKMTTNVEVYDHLADCWVVVPELELPRPLAYHGLDLINGEVYVTGGACTDATNTKTFWHLDIEKFQWVPAQPMLMPRAHLATAVADDGHLYAISGKLSRKNRLKESEVYDSVICDWTPIHKLNEPRIDAASVVLNGKLYLIGGYNGFTVHREMIYFCPVSQSWVNSVPMIKCRSGLRCIAYCGYIFAIGGYDGRTRMCCAERFDSRTDTWTMLASMKTARSNFGVARLDNRIFVFGGCTEGFVTMDETEVYDVLEDRWYSAAPLNQRKSGQAGCVIDNYKFSSRALSEIANRSEAKLSLGNNAHRNRYVDDYSDTPKMFPPGSGHIFPPFIDDLPLPWLQSLFNQVESNDEDDELPQNEIL